MPYVMLKDKTHVAELLRIDSRNEQGKYEVRLKGEQGVEYFKEIDTFITLEQYEQFEVQKPVATTKKPARGKKS